MKRRLKVNLKRGDGTVYGRVGEVKDFPPGTWDQIADSFDMTLAEVSDEVSEDERSAHERMAALELRIERIEKAMGPLLNDPPLDPPPANDPPKDEKSTKTAKKNGGKK